MSPKFVPINLAAYSGQQVVDLRTAEVACTPRLVDGATFRNLRIECRARASDLTHVTFRQCAFNDSYFGNAKLDLAGARFESCRFRNTTFMFGRLRGATFTDCRLQESRMRSADLRDVVFEHCKLVAVDLEGADLHDARFERTELERMYEAGFHDYAGALIADEQKFKSIITRDPGDRLRVALDAGTLAIAHDRVLAFVAALEAASFASGELLLAYDEWKGAISFEDFIVIARFLSSSSPR